MSSSPAWIDFLKRTLGHEDQLHPGTPVYERRRQLTDSITASWHAHLGHLVQSDLLSGAHGRRKHFWEEMECVVVYELGLSIHEGHVASRDYQKLASLALHATYVFCPGFSGKSFCVVSGHHQYSPNEPLTHHITYFFPSSHQNPPWRLQSLAPWRSVLASYRSRKQRPIWPFLSVVRKALRIPPALARRFRCTASLLPHSPVVRACPPALYPSTASSSRKVPSPQP